MHSLRFMTFLAAMIVCTAVGDSLRADDADDQFGLANGFFIKQEYDIAMVRYRKLLEEHADFKQADKARRLIGECLYHLKNYEAAVKELTTLAQKYPESKELAKAYYRLGECATLTEDHEAAAKAYASLFAKDPENALAPSAAYLCGESLYRLKRYQDAAEAFAGLLKDHPKCRYAPAGQCFLGCALHQLGRYDDAAEAFASVVKNHPRDPAAAESQFRLAEARYAAGDYDAAIKEYQKVLGDYDGEFSNDARMGIGSALHAKKDYAAAAKAFMRLSDANPPVPLASLNAANCLYLAEEYDLARGVYAGLINDPKLAGMHRKALYFYGLCQMKQKDFVDASRRFRKALDAPPGTESVDPAEIRFALGDALLQAGEHAEAGQAFGQLASKSPKHKLADDALANLALCYANLKQYDQAVATSRKLLAGYPDSELAPSGLFNLGEYQFRAGHIEAAAKTFSEFLAGGKAPELVDDALYGLGWCRRKLNDEAAAAKAFAKLVAEHPKSELAPEASFLVGEISLAAKKPEAAADAFKRCSDDYAASPFAEKAAYYVGAADMMQASEAAKQQQKQHIETAAEHFGSFLRKYPASELAADALFHLAQALAETDRLDDAAAHLQTYAGRHGDHKLADRACYLLGHVRSRQNEPQAAVEQFDLLAAKFADSTRAAEAIYRAGEELRKLKQFDEAVVRYRKVIKLHPDSEVAPGSHFGITEALFAQEKCTEAAAELESFIEKNPKSKLLADAYYNLGWNYLKMGNDEKMAPAFEKAAKLATKPVIRASALYELAELDYRSKRYDEAAARYETIASIKGLDFYDKVNYKLGWSWLNLKNDTRAAAAFEALCAKTPDSTFVAEALYNIGRIAERAKQFKQAIERYEKALNDAKPSDELAEKCYLRIGECNYGREKWAEGLKAFQTAAEKFPNGKYVHENFCGIGRCAQREGAYKDAVAAYRKAIAGYSGEAAARAQFGLGECLYLQNDYKGALGEFLIVDFRYAYPQWSAASLLMAARCHLKLDNVEKAETYLKQVATEERFKGTSHAEEARAELQRLNAEKKVNGKQ